MSKCPFLKSVNFSTIRSTSWALATTFDVLAVLVLIWKKSSS